MARVPVMAAGGIVMRREQPPLIAVVRLRKRDEWVLPKGKLDEGETARSAARREVLEETGHNVTVHEFLGTLVYESGGRSKVVHYWRMEAGGSQTRELMDDVRAVDWLPLEAAIARLSRGYERTFLENVGPLAVSVLMRRLKVKAPAQPPAVKAAPAKKRRATLPAAAPAAAPPVEAAWEQTQPASAEPVGSDMAATPEVPLGRELSQAPATLVDEEFIPQVDAAEAETASAAESGNDGVPDPDANKRQTLAQRVRNWLGRAA
ncbi:MAG: NUDIX hydrolase [Bradyrhizobium sp.]|nr:NUDIX hydrolase [Bradyrhizobium sp.]